MHAPITAEIYAGISPTWHIVRATPGREFFAMKHLAYRRFGCYLPVLDEWAEQIRIKQSPLFPSYVFLFVWGLAEHIGRVRDTPGIAGFLVNGDGFPIKVPDAIVADVQAIEWQCWLDNLPRTFFRRRKRHEQWTIQNWRSPNYGFAHPDPNERINALHQALGIKC